MARTELGRKGKADAPLPAIPDKLYFRIGEVARLLALPAYVLRFWETEFPHLKPGKGGTGQRLYRRRDVEALLEIRTLLHDRGYTIAGARQLLREQARVDKPLSATQPAEPEATVPQGVTAGLRQLQSGLRELSNLLHQPPQHAPGKPLPHRGLHMTGKRRGIPEDPPPLFAAPESTHKEDPPGE